MASSEEETMFITCEVCDLPFTGIKPYEQHMNGRKHKKQLKNQKNKTQVQSGDENLCLDETKCSDAQEYICDVCETAFSGIVPYTQHLKGKPHAKVLRRKNAKDYPAQIENADNESEFLVNDVSLNEMVKNILPKQYASCTICEKQFSGPETYLAHVTGKFHRKRKFEICLLEKIKEILGICKASDSEENSQENGFAADKELKCKDCGKAFSGAISFAQHLMSKTHAKRESQNELLEELKEIIMMEVEGDSSSSEDGDSSQLLTCEICSTVFCGPENLKAHIRSKRHQKAVTLKKHLAKKDKSTADRNHTNPQEEDYTKKPFTGKDIDTPVKTESISTDVAGDKPLVGEPWVILEHSS